MKRRLVITFCTLLLTGCGDSAKEPEAQGKGLRQYDRNVLARGPDGKLLPPPEDGNGRVWRLSSSQMKQFVHQGSPDGRANMPAWQGKLSDQEIDEVVTWITSLWSDAVYLEWLTGVEQRQLR